MNTSVPQLAEAETPRTQDVPGEDWFYYEYMTRVYVADGLSGEHPALRVMLPDLNRKVAGEAVDRATTLAQAHPGLMEIRATGRDVLSRISPTTALHELRRVGLAARVIGFIGHLDVCQQVTPSSDADTFIGERETPECARSAAATFFFNGAAWLNEGLEIRRVMLSRAPA